ncbi:MAG TPA: hypothetical protein VLB80_00885 [Candidatus Babeliales bacterium]|nr:hypothetical protein [Candidatus Babeliales bacterium]
MHTPYNRFHIITLFFSALLCIPITAEYSMVKMTVNSGNQTHSVDFTRNRSQHDFSHNNKWDNPNVNKSSSHRNHFDRYTPQDFQQHFIAQQYAESQILNQHCLYMFDNFVKFAQTYSSYQCAIQQLYTELNNLNIIQKAHCIIKGTYCPGLQKRIHFLYDQLNTLKHKAPAYTASAYKEHSLETFPAQQSEYKALQSTYNTHTPSLSTAIGKRVDAYKDMTKGDYALQYTSKSYNLNNNVQQLLSHHEHDATRFTQCYGHQLHHVIHQESLDILNRIDTLPHNSMLHDHQEALIDFTVAMVDYNHENLTDKAMHIGDLCWTLLDYGQAVAEGAALGVYSAATDILNNPIQVTISIVAGKQVFTYQLCKVLYNVADIGVTAINNLNNAKEKWNKYTEPLNDIIDAIYKKELTVRDAIKGGTAFVVGYKAQGKLLGGLGKFCNTIQQKAVRFAQNNVSSFTIQEYLATPEGYLLQSVAKTSCTASCPNQYDNLK